jgi:hypothetical protein
MHFRFVLYYLAGPAASNNNQNWRVMVLVLATRNLEACHSNQRGLIELD